MFDKGRHNGWWLGNTDPHNGSGIIEVMIVATFNGCRRKQNLKRPLTEQSFSTRSRLSTCSTRQPFSACCRTVPTPRPRNLMSSCSIYTEHDVRVLVNQNASKTSPVLTGTGMRIQNKSGTVILTTHPTLIGNEDNDVLFMAFVCLSFTDESYGRPLLFVCLSFTDESYGRPFRFVFM